MTIQAKAARELIAGNVRAELRRRGLVIKDLGGINNRSSSYWQRRTSGELAFEIDELIVLADFMHMPLAVFLQGVEPPEVTPHDAIRGKPRPVFPPNRLHATHYELAA